MAQTGRLRNAIENFLSEFDFSSVYLRILENFRERDESELVDYLGPMLDFLIKATPKNHPLYPLLVKAKTREHQVGQILLQSIQQKSGDISIQAAFEPLKLLFSYYIWDAMPLRLGDPSAIIEIQKRYHFDKFVYNTYMEKHGFDTTWSDQLLDISLNRLPPEALFRVLQQYPDKAQEVTEELSRAGWDNKHLDWLKLLSYQRPSAGEWIRFAVREATNEQQVEYLGLDQNFPHEAERQAELAGLLPGMFKYYWRSHWELPTISHAFEFLHRLRPGRQNVSFTLQDFSSLLVALDISPKWHDYYRAVSYAPIGRVDLRRIYKTTNKDRNWLIEQYQDVDYSLEDATTLADWTIIDAEQSLRDASLSTIEKSVERGILTEGEAQIALEALKYGADDIKIYLANWRYAREDKRISAEIDYLKVRYLAAELTEEQLRSELNNLGLSPNNIAIAMANLNAQRKRQVVALSVGQIEDMYEENILDYNQMVAELEARGTTKINAKRLAQLIDVKRQRKTDKELEAAQKEQERIAASEAKSDKQIATAELQVQIATRNAEVADLKKIYPDITDLDTLTAIETRLAEIKQEVAYLQLEKTKVNLQYAERIETNA